MSGSDMKSGIFCVDAGASVAKAGKGVFIPSTKSNSIIRHAVRVTLALFRSMFKMGFANVVFTTIIHWRLDFHSLLYKGFTIPMTRRYSGLISRAAVARYFGL